MLHSLYVDISFKTMLFPFTFKRLSLFWPFWSIKNYLCYVLW